jgi:hypothetical protein
MTSIEAYKNFLLRLNKNDSNTNINISKGEFVLIYNHQKDRWFEEKLDSKNNSIDIHDLGILYEVDKELIEIEKTINSVKFKLPDNFGKFDSSYSLASKKECKDRPLVNWLVKPKNLSVLLQDTNNKPSFEYEETICILSNDKLVVYKDNFSIDKVYLSYYKLPKKIDIEGYIKIDGILSTTIDPDDLDDNSIHEIINRCVIEVIRSYENPQGFQLAQERIKTEN